MTRYSGTLESLATRTLPDWYQEARFGIFIHWGIFSIPAFAPHVGKISDAGRQDYDRAIALSPYTEWYSNSIKVPGTPAAEFHRERYGEQPYEQFRDPFLAGLESWDPGAWARIFRGAGARYVVLVTKHHDGFCLWPTEVDHPLKSGWHTQRDVVGELARAVRAEGLRFGVYYSGGIDWSFNPRPLRTLGDFIGSVPGGSYPAYANAQVRELIARYQPDVLWNDICWPEDLGELLQLFADYYHQVPEGVVNDRWKHRDWAMRLLGTVPGRKIFDLIVKRQLARHPEETEGVIPPVVPHSDFRTPEYTVFPDIQRKPWEATRGMSHSFGFNRNDREEDYATARDLVHGLIDCVSKNGNLLLNVGPRGVDAGIPDEQRTRLETFGRWLGRNGDAIYGTSPWTRAEGVTDEGIEIRFTCKPGVLYLIMLGEPAGTRCRIRDLQVSGQAEVLADGAPVNTEIREGDLCLEFTRPPKDDVAIVVRVDTG